MPNRRLSGFSDLTKPGDRAVTTLLQRFGPLSCPTPVRYYSKDYSVLCAVGREFRTEPWKFVPGREGRSARLAALPGTIIIIVGRYCFSEVNPSNEYHRQEILSASPLQLVVKLYDIAIASCFRNDRQKLRRALAELMSALNVEEGGEIASNLAGLYEYCIDQSVAGDLDQIRSLLVELRDAWKSIELSSAA